LARVRWRATEPQPRNRWAVKVGVVLAPGKIVLVRRGARDKAPLRIARSERSDPPRYRTSCTWIRIRLWSVKYSSLVSPR